MDSQTLMLVGMGVVVLLLGLAAWAYTSRRRRMNLRERFGPEKATPVSSRAITEPGTGHMEDGVQHRRRARSGWRISPT